MDSSDDIEFTLSELMKRNDDDDENDRIEIGESIGETNDEWFKDRATYELHFNQLQEQLVAAMVQNQQLLEESKKLDRQSLSELNQCLEEEKLKRKKAENYLKLLTSKKKRTNSSCSSTSMDPDLDDLNGDLSEDRNIAESDSTVSKKHKFSRKFLEYKISFWNFMHERLSDFNNDEDIVVEQIEEEQLSVRRLKENVHQFTEALQPIKGYYNSLYNLLSWKFPWITLSVFLLYSYSFWVEMAIPLLLFLMILQMSWNYMQAMGITKKFSSQKKKISEEVPKDDQGLSSLSERYQLVLLIAKQVQNTLGYLADSLEKVQNLLLWQHKRASTMLFQFLLLGFAISIIFSTDTFFMAIGLLTGIKLFIITPIYASFPKVQKRYDDFSNLWEELPNHKENMRRKIEEIVDRSVDDEESSSPEPSFHIPSASTTLQVPVSIISDEQIENVSHDAIVFCDRFSLPISEAPHHDWQEGRRCTMMDKESPLSSMRHGRMYLTPSYLCFERNQFHSKKNIALELKDLTAVKKAKPISFMPGNGMAIEVAVKELSKPFIFGAMIGRDEAFDSIIKAGKLLNLSWSQV